MSDVRRRRAARHSKTRRWTSAAAAKSVWDAKRRDFLDAHLNVSWLRPESALCDAIASDLIAAHPLASPALDLGSGNGIFSFITAGGRFADEYDWYRNVDVSGFWDNQDIYDRFVAPIKPEWITRRPLRGYDVALDAKRSLLRQAQGLDWYGRIVQADANRPLPFAQESFQTIFSNILCWLQSPEAALQEIRRLLKPTGRVYLCLQDPVFKRYCPSYQWRKRGSELLRLLNRGRDESSAWALSMAELKRLCKRVGLRVATHTSYLSPLTLKAWDIGLRPLSPVFVKMLGKLNEDDRLEIKREWIETLRPFLLELLAMDRASRARGGFLFLTLERSR